MKKILFIAIFVIATFGVCGAFPAHAEDATVDAYFFWGDGCPHCGKEKEFLFDMAEEYGERVNIYSYEVWFNSANRELMLQMAEERNVRLSGVPALFVGDEVIVGFGSASTTGEDIRELIDTELQKQTSGNTNESINLEPNENNPAEAESTNTNQGSEGQEEQDPEEETIRVPVLGEIDPGSYSILGLTVVIAAVDGFNPCAMWVLILLIGLLIGMQDKKRLWFLGSLFIFVSGLVYFLFLAAWFNIFHVIGAVRTIQMVVGIFALGVGVYYVRRFFTSKPGECKVTNIEQKRKISERMKAVVRKKSLLFAGLGIIVLAGLVNTIELACSAGLPAIYTQILSLSDLAGWQYYAYLILYVFIFMLDDLIIFGIAVTTLRAASTTGKFSHIATLIGGIIILLLGALLIFKPELILFG